MDSQNPIIFGKLSVSQRARRSGVADHYAADDAHALQIVRDIVKNLNRPKRVDLDLAAPHDPAFDPAEIDRNAALREISAGHWAAV